jgi:hypothetical protein
VVSATHASASRIVFLGLPTRLELLKIDRSLASDVHLSGRYFIVAHFDYIMEGGTVMAYMGEASLLVAQNYWPSVS